MLGARSLADALGCSTVTYGGMAKQALSIPPSLFIFKKLTAFVSTSPLLPFSSLTLPSSLTAPVSGSPTGSKRTLKSA